MLRDNLLTNLYDWLGIPRSVLVSKLTKLSKKSNLMPSSFITRIKDYMYVIKETVVKRVVRVWKAITIIANKVSRVKEQARTEKRVETNKSGECSKCG